MKLGLAFLGLTTAHYIGGFDHDHVRDDMVPAEPVIYNPPMAPAVPEPGKHFCLLFNFN